MMETTTNKFVSGYVIERKRCITCATFLFLVLILSCTANQTTSTHRISQQGQYKGYSEALYAEDYYMSSQYITMRDGTNIAIDIYRPKDKVTGEVINEPLPVLWMHTPYNRRYTNPDKKELTVENYAGTASRLIKYGYVVATADFRGLYASYGHNEAYNRGEWVSSAQYDAYDITEWLAVQPWSNGKIGMWGCSATGGSQMQAITTAPPHLKAIFPMSFEFDVYDFRVPGGITAARGGVVPRKPGDPTPQQTRDAHASPVDGDTDSSQLKLAITGHEGTIESPGYVPFRDSYSQELKDEASKQWWIKSSPVTYLDKINASGIAMYMAVNWDEGNTKPGPFFAFNNFKTPNKLIVGPGVHCDWNTAMTLTGFDIVVEELRFFDYWLKDIDNGIMDEDPVYYFTYNTPPGKEWRSAKTWPLPEEKRVNFYLGEETLVMSEKPKAEGADKITVNYDWKSDNRNHSVMIYETAPLEKDIRVTGHPSINLWISSTATDGDFVATVKDVSPDTITSYNVQGQLRASMRKLAEPPYNNLGLPWHSFVKKDVTLLVPHEPTELEFSLLPTSILFKAGHKIRLEISFVTRGTQKLEPSPQVTIYRHVKHQSFLTLPIIEE